LSRKKKTAIGIWSWTPKPMEYSSPITETWGRIMPLIMP